MDVSVGQGDKRLEGVGIGTLTGGLVSLGIPFTDSPRTVFYPGTTAAKKREIAVVLGAIAGLGLGAIIGSSFHTDVWEPVGGGDAGLAFLPVLGGDGTVGVQMRFVPGMAR